MLCCIMFMFINYVPIFLLEWTRGARLSGNGHSPYHLGRSRETGQDTGDARLISVQAQEDR